MKIAFILFFLLLIVSTAKGQTTFNSVKIKDLALPSEIPSRASVVDANGKLKSSAVTAGELEQLSGVSSNVQNQIDSVQTGITDHLSDTTPHATIQGASIEAPIRSDVKQDTEANLLTYALTATNGQVVFATDTKQMYQIVDGDLVAVGSAGGLSAWETSHDYIIGDVVHESNRIYVALSAHTSGTFSTDLAAAKWFRLNDEFSVKNDASSPTAIRELQAPNNQFTSVASDKARLETGNNNILSNPSFEALPDPKLGWTAPTSPTLETSDVQNGKQALCYSLSDAPFEISQDSTINATGFANGTQGMARISVQASSDTTQKIMVCPRRAGAIVSNLCKEVGRDGKWKDIQIPFILGGTSNGISVHTEGYANATATRICVDDASVGKEKVTQSLDQSRFFGSAKWTGSANCVWTVANTSFTSMPIDADCSNPTTTGSISAPTTKIPAIVLPNGSPEGTYKVIAKALYYANTSGATGTFRLSDGTVSTNAGSINSSSGGVGVPEMTFTYEKTSSSEKTLAFQCAATTGSCFVYADSSYRELSMEVYYYPPSSTSVYSSTNADTDWQTCTISGSWTTNTTYSAKCQRKGSNLKLKAYLALTGAPTAANLTVNLPSGYVIDTTKLAASTLASQQFGQGYANNGSAYYPIRIAYNNTTSVGFTVQQTANTAVHADSGLSNTVPFTFANGHSVTFDLEVPIVGWENSNVIIGSFAEIPTTRGSNGADIQSVYFGSSADCSAACTTGSCTICNRVGTKITSVDWVTTGDYKLMGIDGTKYNCFGQAFTTASAVNAITHRRHVSTSTYAAINASNSAGAWLNAGLASVTCIGIP